MKNSQKAHKTYKAPKYSNICSLCATIYRTEIAIANGICDTCRFAIDDYWSLPGDNLPGYEVTCAIIPSRSEAKRYDDEN
jgi:hypothetical protein